MSTQLQERVLLCCIGLLCFLPLAQYSSGSNPSEGMKFTLLLLSTGIISTVALFSLVYRKVCTLPRLPLLWIGAGLWATSLTLSTLLSLAPIESFFGTFTGLRGSIGGYALLILLFGLVFTYHHLPKAKSITTLSMCYAGALVSSIGIIQYFFLDTTPFFGDGALFSHRIYSTLSNPNDLGQYLIFPFAFGATAFLQQRGRQRISLLICLLLISIALFLTRNRASFLGIGCILLALFWTTQKTTILRYKNISLLIGSTFLIVLGNILLHMDLRSFASRILLWQASFPTLQDHLFFGSGVESFYQAIQYHLPKALFLYEPLSAIPESPHNFFLSTGVEQGLFGLAVLLIIFVWAVKEKFFCFSTLSAPTYALLGYIISLLFGVANLTGGIMSMICIALLCSEKIKQQKTYTLALFPKTVLAILCFFFSIGILGSGIRFMEGYTLLAKGEKHFFNQDQKWEQEVTNATLILPYAYPIETFSLFSSTPLPKALREKQRIITGGNFTYLQQEAKEMLQRGDYEKAKRSIEEAWEKAPYLPRLSASWAITTHEFGWREETESAVAKYFSQIPPDWDVLLQKNPLTLEEKEKLRIFKLSNVQHGEMLSIQKELSHTERTPLQ